MAMALAVTLTALPFALIHGMQLEFSWAPLLVIFFVGVILTWVRAHSRSLAASWIVHVSYNTTLLAFMFVQTGGFRHLR
jgi:membrane protease YdiL (CAAX protease family)